jgi:hypothetical protein
VTDTFELPDRLKQMPVEQLQELLCQTHPGVWAEVNLGFTNAPFHWEWYRLMIDERRLCVIAPREHAKSQVFTVNGSAWRICYRPGCWTYVFAATLTQAEELKSRIDAAVAEVRPELLAEARSLTKRETVYSNYARVTVASVGKAVRGAHPEVIIGDDVLTEDLAVTEHQRKKTASWWFGTVGGMTHPGTWRMVPGHGRIWFPATQVFLVGTPFHSQDLLMAMRTNAVWNYRRYAAEYDVSRLVEGSWAIEVSNG